jgi:hypothetical protein
MKSLHSLIRQSALVLMAVLLLVFSVLIYAGGDALLHRFVDGRLFGLAETMAKIIEQHPDIIESSGEEYAPETEVIRGKNTEREVTHSLRIFSPDGRLVWKSPNAVAQTRFPIAYSNKSSSGTVCIKPLKHWMAGGLYASYSFLFPCRGRYGTFCRPRHRCSCTGRH